MRKFLVLVVALTVVGGLGWWYFSERHLPSYGPAYREYAYVTNGKSNTVSVIDLRTFQPARTIHVGNEPTGIAANGKKNEVYVVNTQSNSVSVIDAERNEVVATIGVHAAPYFIDVSADGKRAYVANSKSANVSVIDLDKRLVLGNIRVGAAPGLARVSPDGSTVVVSNRGDRFRLPDRRRTTQSTKHDSGLRSAGRHRNTSRQQQSVRGMRWIGPGRIHRPEN